MGVKKSVRIAWLARQPSRFFCYVYRGLALAFLRKCTSSINWKALRGVAARFDPPAAMSALSVGSRWRRIVARTSGAGIALVDPAGDVVEKLMRWKRPFLTSREIFCIKSGNGEEGSTARGNRRDVSRHKAWRDLRRLAVAFGAMYMRHAVGGILIAAMACSRPTLSEMILPPGESCLKTSR